MFIKPLENNLYVKNWVEHKSNLKDQKDFLWGRVGTNIIVCLMQILFKVLEYGFKLY